MQSNNLSVAVLNFAQRWFLGTWQKRVLTILVLTLLGVGVWSQRISRSHGFLMDDSTYLHDSLDNRLGNFYLYLPGVVAHRPIGRDFTTLLLRLFGERGVPFVWTSLFIHLASSVLLWLALHRLTSNWWASLAGATFFLLNVSVYLAVYWPADVFDILASFFVACLLLCISLIVQPKGEYRPWLLLLTLPLLVAAVKSKESSVVAIIPLFSIVFLSNPKRNQTGAGRPSFQISEIIQRLRKISSWEVAWVVVSVVLAGVLAMTVISDFGAQDPTHPYYSEYSPQVIGRSFGFYLALLAFRTDYGNSIPWLLGLVLALVPLVAAVLLRNRWMFLGWLWFVVFLLPLAALKNHYMILYYPYPACIGAALVIAGLFWESEKLATRWRAARVLRYALPIVFIIVVVQQSFGWFRNDSVPRWFDDLHARSSVVERTLKDALPQPPHGAEIVLVIPEFTHFDQNPSTVLKIIYHDTTLTGALFKEQQQADAYLAQRTSGNTFLAFWNGTSFELEDLSHH
jgi:hypothetical protein